MTCLLLPLTFLILRIFLKELKWTISSLSVTIHYSLFDNVQSGEITMAFGIVDLEFSSLVSADCLSQESLQVFSSDFLPAFSMFAWNWEGGLP